MIVLKNGSRIVGTIQKEEAGKVYIDADLLGPIVIDATALAPAAPETVTPPPTMPEPVAPVVTTATQAPAELPTHAAAKVVWKRIFSINGSYNSAAYVQGAVPGAPAELDLTGKALGLSGTQSMVQFNGMILRATPTLAVSLSGSYAYAKYEPAGAVVDNYKGEFQVTRMLSDRRYLLARSSYKVDQISLIDRSFEQVIGYGFKLIDTDRTKLDVIPGLSEVNEVKGTEFDDEWIFSAGFLQHLEFAFNERVSLKQQFKYRIGVTDTEVWAINSYLGLESQLSEHVSLTVGLTYTYDNTLGPLPPSLANGLIASGVPVEIVRALRPGEKGQLQLTSGLQYKW